MNDRDTTLYVRIVDPTDGYTSHYRKATTEEIAASATLLTENPDAEACQAQHVGEDYWCTDCGRHWHEHCRALAASATVTGPSMGNGVVSES